MLLEYLVPSRARRQVWKALPRQGSALTVREIARRAGVSYSNAHREILRMNELGLLRTQLAGKALLCAWNVENPATRQLTSLLEVKESAGGPPGDETVYGNLKSLGAGLARNTSSRHPLSLEE